MARWIMALAAVSIASGATAQVVLEDRTVEGRLVFTQTSPPPPEIRGSGIVYVRSVGLALALDNEGRLVPDPTLPPHEAAHRTVVQAFGGDYWFTAKVELVAGGDYAEYQFGYASHVGGRPGYPNFTGVYQPFTRNVSVADPNPITGVDLRECAGLVRIHFVDADPTAPGGFRPTTQPIVGATVAANPRLDPSDSVAPFEYAVTDTSIGNSINGRSQSFRIAERPLTDLDLWVRSSAQVAPAGSDIRYQVHVRWDQECTLPNPACPSITRVARFNTWFEGVTLAGAGLPGVGAESAPGEHEGVFIDCNRPGPHDLYVIVTPCAPLCPIPPGSIEGCAGLIGEREVVTGPVPNYRCTFVSKFEPTHEAITNHGEPIPAHFPWHLFDNFDPSQSEGVYRLDGIAPEPVYDLRAGFALDPYGSPPTPRNLVFAPALLPLLVPPPGETILGTDFCSVPGFYQGVVRLRDAAGSRGSGALRSMDLGNSSIAAGTIGGWTSANGGASYRDFRGSAYDATTGRLDVSYTNVIASSDHRPGRWWQQTQVHSFLDRTADPARFVSGSSRLSFIAPQGVREFVPLSYVSVGAGGTWTGPLLPSTQISPREERTMTVNYEMCYSALRIQIESRTALFFHPRFSYYQGHFFDAHTIDPADDVGYDVTSHGEWSGSPQEIEDASRNGAVNLRLPQGKYRNVTGFVTSVLDDHGRIGTTALPPFDMDVPCGLSCTLLTSPTAVTPLAILCMDPLSQCNDPAVLAGAFTLTGAIKHERPLARGWWSIDGGAENPFDLAVVGVTCSPAPCEDVFSVSVDARGQTHACVNRIVLGFEDVAGSRIEGILTAIIDTTPPTLRLETASGEPVPCGAELHGCEGELALPVPVATDDCSPASDPGSGLTVTSDAPVPLPVGTVTVVTYTARDACDNEATCSVSLLVDAGGSPTIECPPPIVLDCHDAAGVRRDDPRLAAWLAGVSYSGTCGGELTLTDDAPEVFPSGCAPGFTTVVTFTATNTSGASVSCTSTVTVVASGAPTFEAQPTGVVLWPPQHGIVVLSIEDTGARVRGTCSEATMSFTGCASSQPEDSVGRDNGIAGGDGHSECDCSISPDGHFVALRAERHGGCAPIGRTYGLRITATDACGNVALSDSFSACVPHDRAHWPDGNPREISANPGSHQPDDPCAEQGWINGTYPSPRAADACGQGCAPSR